MINEKSIMLSKTTNIPSSIPKENTNIESSPIPGTAIIESTTLNNSTKSNSNKLKIFLFGYDNYSFRDNTTTFSLYIL